MEGSTGDDAIELRVTEASAAVKRATSAMARAATDLAAGDQGAIRRLRAAQRRFETANKELEYAMQMQRHIQSAAEDAVKAAQPIPADPMPGTVPKREQVLHVLDEMGVPLSGGVIADIGRARF